MRVTVTGASGTLGLACTEMLLRAGHRVRAFVRSEERFRDLVSDPRADVIAGDIRERAEVAEAVEGMDAVLHCVAFPPSQYTDNWDALRHALEGLKPGGQFVFPGNLWVYGPPESDRVGPSHPKASPSRLGRIRADLEKAVTAEGGTVVHLPDVYGPGVRSGRIHALFDRAFSGKKTYLHGDLDRPIEFLYLADAARALIAPLGRRQARGIDYTAAGYRPTTPREFVTLIYRAAAREPRVRSISIRVARAMDLLNVERRQLSDLYYLEECSTLLDGRLIRSDLGWMPEVDYADGVRRTIRWLREQQSSTPD
jgi:nucleoside-diphosphate-sugar epimerase